jgi:ElaB/YqjD/DUF883 family membrane-anchored ribosome-binding protein
LLISIQTQKGNQALTNKPFGSSSDPISTATSTMREAAAQAQDEAAELAQKASEFGRTAVGALDAPRSTAASAIDSAATALHENAERLPATVGKFAHQTADTLSTTADYVRDNTMRDVVTDLKGYVKAHPTQALVGAAVVGFMAGRLLQRD